MFQLCNLLLKGDLTESAEIFCEGAVDSKLGSWVVYKIIKRAESQKLRGFLDEKKSGSSFFCSPWRQAELN